MKKTTVIFALLLSFSLGVGLGNWLSQEKRLVLAIESEGKQSSEFTPPLAGVISVKNTVNSSAYDLQEAFNTVATVATRAVVSIQVTVTVSDNRFQFGNDDFFRRFFGIPENPTPQRSSAFGSGFLIDPEGYLLSNNHVVENAEEIKILFKDNDKTYTAKVVGADPDTDVALLKINEPGPFPFLTLGDSEEVQIGDIAIAIGNPFGLSHTFTTGVVSAKGRSGIVGNRYENFIQTDVAINQGNSGGPLLNLNGKVIGINSAILSRSGGSIGIGFSIPINMAKNVAEQLRQYGKVSRGWIGIYFEEVSGDLSEALNVPKGSISVSQVVEGSPAEKAGIKAGDVIYSFDKKRIKGGSDLLNKVSTKSKGDTVDIGLIRNGKEMNFSVTLEEEEREEMIAKSKSQENSRLGVAVRNLTTSEQQKLGNNQTGVAIDRLSPRSPLLAAGVQEDDIIISLNKQPVKSALDFNNQINQIKEGAQVLMKIQRGQSIRYIVVRL